jgi:hypothetical protein
MEVQISLKRKKSRRMFSLMMRKNSLMVLTSWPKMFESRKMKRARWKMTIPRDYKRLSKGQRNYSDLLQRPVGKLLL